MFCTLAVCRVIPFGFWRSSLSCSFSCLSFKTSIWFSFSSLWASVWLTACRTASLWPFILFLYTLNFSRADRAYSSSSCKSTFSFTFSLLMPAQRSCSSALCFSRCSISLSSRRISLHLDLSRCSTCGISFSMSSRASFNKNALNHNSTIWQILQKCSGSQKYSYPSKSRLLAANDLMESTCGYCDLRTNTAALWQLLLGGNWLRSEKGRGWILWHTALFSFSFVKYGLNHERLSTFTIGRRFVLVFRIKFERNIFHRDEMWKSSRGYEYFCGPLWAKFRQTNDDVVPAGFSEFSVSLSGSRSGCGCADWHPPLP